jgi:hypothetical protein
LIVCELRKRVENGCSQLASAEDEDLTFHPVLNVLSGWVDLGSGREKKLEI